MGSTAPLSTRPAPRDAGERRIFDIQGSNRTSPLRGMRVTTSGVVTAVLERGFYIQDPRGDGKDATSDGIFVHSEAPHSVRVGDAVSVRGTVREYVPRDRDGHLSRTELDDVHYCVVSRNNRLPAPVQLGAGGRVPPNASVDRAIDFFESLDGMRVSVPHGSVIGPKADKPCFTVLADGTDAQPRTSRGGLAATKEEQHTARLHVRVDRRLLPSGYEPKVSVGDAVMNVVGVMRYQHGTYEVSATEPFATVRPGRLAPDVTRLVGTPTAMTIAWFNIENFDPHIESVKRLEARDRPNDDIGSGRAALLGKQIAVNLRAPDVIGLGEVQDNDGIERTGVVDASKTYEAVIEAIVAAGGPRYAWTDLPPRDDADGGEPGGNIRVGFLYRPDRVKLDRSSLARIGEGDAAFEGSRKSLRATFEMNGDRVTVIANHFASKLGSTPLFGKQPPTNGGEATRSGQAEIVRRHVEQMLSDDPKAKVALVGDFNELAYNEPMSRLAGRTLVNLGDKLPKGERYTFNFEGLSQAIDHGLVAGHMAESSELEIVHLNADFAERSSDHDPFVMRLALG